MTSGAWELIRRYPHGSEKLLMIAQKAHQIAGSDGTKVNIAVKESRWLDFYDKGEYKSIKIDVLVYADENNVKDDTGLPYFFYITKGLKADCVYFLEKKYLTDIRLTLGKHVCGLSLPAS